MAFYSRIEEGSDRRCVTKNGEREINGRRGMIGGAHMAVRGGRG
jgi:hypothetical protein